MFARQYRTPPPPLATAPSAVRQFTGLPGRRLVPEAPQGRRLQQAEAAIMSALSAAFMLGLQYLSWV
mgnify:CR=1 FL=1